MKTTVAIIALTTSLILPLTAAQADDVGSLELRARPWAKVTVQGRSCTTPCTVKLRPGSHRVTFRKGGRTIVRTVTVAAGRLATLEVDMQRALTAPPGRTGKVTFAARPWAKVTVAGKTCTTRCSRELAPGKYLAVFRRGKEARTRTFEVAAGSSLELRVDFTKDEPAPTGFGTVAFSATPWARVSFGGKSCTTPCRMTAPIGEHTAVFVQGGKKRRQTFRVRRGATTPVKVDMTAAPGERGALGTARFEARPWAKVTVDGRTCTTMCTMTLPAGRYEAVFRRKGKTVTRAFEVAGDRETILRVNMLEAASAPAGGSGTVRFHARPWARVSVAGKTCTTTCTMKLPAGEHRASFRQGGKTVSRDFVVAAGRETIVRVNMAGSAAAPARGASGTVRLKARPWARVTVGSKTCTTLCRLKLAAGRHVATFRYKSATKRVAFVVEAGKTADVMASFD